MKNGWIKRSFPKSLYGRAALILIVPIVTLQLVVSVVFIQRHFEGVTAQMTRNVELEVQYLLDLVLQASDPDLANADVAQAARDLQIEILLPAARSIIDTRPFYDLSGITITQLLYVAVPGLKAVDLGSNGRKVALLIGTRHGDVLMQIDRRRLSASNPHQLLVLMIFTGVLMTVIAFVFLRNQLRPIRRLSRASEAFGKGRSEPYRPSGATEVRLAGQAFLDMRARIERQIEQRTLMLSGVSHDLRTPLTRMKLALSLGPETAETNELARDIADMERMLDAFLDFARSDALDDPASVDPAALVQEVAGRYGDQVEVRDLPPPMQVQLRALAIERALQNLIGNARNYGTACVVSLEAREKALVFVVEDNGPGIPPDLRDAAVKAFTRLDAARNQNRGGGVGLGLAIASDIARQHGGLLRLGESETLGGLKAELVVAR